VSRSGRRARVTPRESARPTSTGYEGFGIETLYKRAALQTGPGDVFVKRLDRSGEREAHLDRPPNPVLICAGVALQRAHGDGSVKRLHSGLCLTVDSRSLLWWDQAPLHSEVDGSVPQPQRVNFAIVR
jgi:hypothetical protein